MTTRAIRIAVLLSLAGLVAMVSRAQDPFAPDKQLKTALDPFALEFQYKSTGQPKVEAKEPAKTGDAELSLTSKAFLKMIDFKLKVDPPQAKRGEVVRLIIEGTPRGEYYTYSLTKKTKDTSSGNIPRITIKAPDAVVQLYPQEETPEPKLKKSKSGEVLMTLPGAFTWTQPFQVKNDAKPGATKLPIAIKLMVCDKNSCTNPDYYPPLETTLDILEGDPVKTTLGSLTTKNDLPQLVASGSDGLAKGDTPTPDGVSGSFDPKNLSALLLSAFLGALFMLLTPCVFPMIPITVNFFIKQSEKEHHNPLQMATVYAGTIITLLALTMVMFGSVVVYLANNPWFNLALGGVLIFFALSLFGMFEIELPHFLARFTSAREGKGGNIGAVFMALTFTITSFTCTGPFLGLLLTPYAELQPPLIYRILAAVVYSVTFAAPFFFLALFPALLKKLPKSGGWMNSIKVVMGFLELGAALKFLANCDYALFPGRPRIFTYDAVLCSWIALCLACGLYLLGQFRLPHDDPQDSVGVVRMVFGTVFLGMTLYMLPLLLGGKPTGVVGEALQAFLPPRLEESDGLLASNGRGGNRSEKLPWHKDYIDAWKQAKAEKKLIFIDFTGINCTNCRDNEKNVFSKADVVEEFKKYVLVALYTDSVPNPNLSSSESAAQAERNTSWRDTLSQRITLPTYLVFRPDYEEPFDAKGLPKGTVLGVRDGTIFDKADFVAFLKRPLENLAWHQDNLDAWAKANKAQTAAQSPLSP